MKNSFRLIATGCCAIFLIAYLFLPFFAIVLTGIGASAIQLLQMMQMVPACAWCLVPVIAGIAMVICTLLLPGKKACLVNAIGSVLPLITYFIVQASMAGSVNQILSGTGAPPAGHLAASVLTVGAGVIVSLIFGIAAAVLAYLSENARTPVQRTAGLGASEDDEW